MSAPAGARGFYLTAGLAMLVSIDTSWRFFGDVLGITALWERAVMFSVLEIGLLACGWGMRANVVAVGRPGVPRLFAWGLCAVAGLMAWELSGPAQGLARVILGPVLGLVMLHLALGIEIRTRHQRTGTWARIAHELRERVLSRLGLGDDTRDAVTRTRDRAARRAARLALSPRAPFRRARLARALRAAGVSFDRHMRGRMLGELATLRHADGLAELDQAAPWAPTPVSPTPVQTVTKSIQAPRDPEPTPAPITVVPRAERTRRPRNGRTDEELIEDLRRHIAETGAEIGKRLVMSQLGVGSDRALRILHAVKVEGEDTA